MSSLSHALILDSTHTSVSATRLKSSHQQRRDIRVCPVVSFQQPHLTVEMCVTFSITHILEMRSPLRERKSEQKRRQRGQSEKYMEEGKKIKLITAVILEEKNKKTK